MSVVLVGEVVIQASQRLVQTRPVAQRPVSVGPVAAVGVTSRLHLGGVVGQQLLEHRVGEDVDPVLMAAEDERVGGIKAAEVEERQRAPVHRVAAVAALKAAVVQIPVGDVVLGVTHDRQVGDEAGRQIEPALVDEVAPHGIDPAVASSRSAHQSSSRSTSGPGRATRSRGCRSRRS